ncbi:hypothetical protein V6O07_06150, partial [Arthrospira platensis SPKY2]
LILRNIDMGEFCNILNNTGVFALLMLSQKCRKFESGLSSAARHQTYLANNYAASFKRKHCHA